MIESCGRAFKAGSFRATYDIVSSLPLELVLAIVKYLDPADILRSQRVSKRWRSIFSSDATIKSLLRRTLTLLGLEGADVPDAEATTYFRWWHSLQHVQPIRKIFLPWPETSETPIEFAYSLRRLFSRIPHEDFDEVEMLNLETGEKLTWTENEAMESGTWNFLISDRYVVIEGDDTTLIAWDIHTLQRYTKEFSCSVYANFIDKDKVVILEPDSEPLYPVYIWDLSSDSVQEINTFIDLCLWHLDAGGNMLVAFEVDWDKHPPEVRQTKWTLSGQLMDRRHFSLSLSDLRVDRKIHKPSREFIMLPIDSNITNGSRTARILPYRDSYYPYCQIRLIYDHTMDKLSAQWYDNSPPSYFLSNTPIIVIPCPYLMYRWEKHTRLFKVYNIHDGTTLMHRYRLDAREAGLREKLVPRPGHKWSIFDREPILRMFGDREIIGMASEDGIQFWVFNPNFTPNLPDAMPFLAMEESG